MKEKIHPQYKETTIVCACGAVVHTRSTKQNIHVEICSKCHPFFTGKQKLVDSAGRVDKFVKRYEKKAKIEKQKSKTQKVNMEEKKKTASFGEVLDAKKSDLEKNNNA